MGKHARGKHGIGKHAQPGQGPGAPKAASEEAAEAPAEGGSPAPSAPPAPKHAAVPGAPGPEGTAPAEEAPEAGEPPSGEAAPAEGAGATEALEPMADAPAGEGADETQALAPAAAEAEPAPAPGPQPAHGAAPAAAGGFVGLDQVGEVQAAERHGKARKVALIALAAVVGVLLAAYLAGVLVFSTRFYPNTHAASFDLSWKTPEAVQQELVEALEGYAFEVEGQGFSMIFTAEDIAMDLDAQAISQGMRTSMNPWLWPAQAFGSHDETGSLAATCATEEILARIAPEVEAVNAEATQPVDATIAYDEETASFEVVPETYGTALDADRIASEIALGIMTFEPTIALDEEALVQPKVYKTDKRLADACSTADEMLVADVDVLLSGQVAATVDGPLIAQWVVLDENLVPKLDDEKLGAWTQELVDRNSTLGARRSYVRADGKAVTVSGGTYGWVIDGDGLAEQVRRSVADGTKGTIDLPVSQSAARAVTDGNPDWPVRYVDVDLSEQYARFYGSDGSIIWETAIVSGKPGGWETPTGVWVVNSKASPSTLIGQRDPETGEPEYETVVTYWMPFIGNSIGFHDATWQSSFGGSRWRNGAGSHGCLNISYSAAQALWGLIGVGDVVVVHY